MSFTSACHSLGWLIVQIVKAIAVKPPHITNAS